MDIKAIARNYILATTATCEVDRLGNFFSRQRIRSNNNLSNATIAMTKKSELHS